MILPRALRLAALLLPLAAAACGEPPEAHAPPSPSASPTFAAAASSAPQPSASDEAKPPPPEVKTVLVPVGAAPLRGPADALVTLVVFCDVNGKFCIKLSPTLRQIVDDYRGKVRVAWKSYPIEMGKNGAEDAVQLAFEARAQKGDEGFWKVHDALLAAAANKDGVLTRKDLESVAKESGLDVKAAMKAVASRKHIDAIDSDRDLAGDLGVYAVPHSFVNGRSVSGAGSFETFAKYVNEEIARAEALVGAGTAPEKVYETLQKSAKTPESMVAVTMPESKDRPSRGDAKAKVVVHLFSDVRGATTATLWNELGALDKELLKKVYFAWYHAPGLSRPLCAPGDGACQAANAAEVATATLASHALAEAYEQKGNIEFWRLAEILFKKQTQPWSKDSLVEDAKQVLLGPMRVAQAIEGAKHKARIEADTKLLATLQARSLPFAVVNGRAVPGAATAVLVERAIRRALRESKAAGK